MLKEIDRTIVMPDYFFWDIHGIIVGVERQSLSGCPKVGSAHANRRHIDFTK